MSVELLLPGRRIPTPKPPSYLALDMAFGVGNPAILGDKSRYRSHGAIVGAVPAVGVHGLCLDFDPTIPSYVLIPAAATQLNFTSENFSMIARIWADSLVGNKIIFTRGDTAADGYWWLVYADGTMALRTNQLAASQDSRTAVGSIAINTWYTVGISRAGVSVLMYRNGVDATFLNPAHIDPATCARSAKIGIRDNLADYRWDGKIEFLRIFRNIALTPSEHLAWHNALV